MPLELQNVRIFDVLRNALNGELALVMSFSGSRLDLRVKTGDIIRYKFGPNFSRVPDHEAIEFRAALRALRKEQEKASGKKRRVRSLAAVLKSLKKKR